MGVDVVLMRVEQFGTSPKRRKLIDLDAVVDRYDVFSRLCADSPLPMLSRVDPYGSLVLSSSEMDQFTAEISTTQQHVSEAAQVDILTEISRLARICAKEPSLELHLDGD